jgi:folate-binding protein YgfZ
MADAGWLWLARDAVHVAGPDAPSYLQGQLSQDVEGLSPGQSMWTLVLQPQGKVEVLARVSRVSGDEFVLDTDAGWGGSLIDRLNRFRLRVKCDVEPVGGWRCAAVRSSDRESFLGHDDRLGVDAEAPAGLREWDVAAYEAARVAAGWPAMGAELTEATIPAECGQWFIDHTVSFTKGCFTGQELVARIDSRGGNVPRHLRGLRMIDTGAPAAVGESVVVDGAEVGTVTSSAGPLALAFIKRAVAPPADALVGGRAARIEALPLVV